MIPAGLFCRGHMKKARQNRFRRAFNDMKAVFAPVSVVLHAI
ncbi:hypothetical protein CFter6_1454 [Collimonas fungivorans]|uniref:Uncharacterized protein n=1 Tax=Collimonas fungivorans TaxID=158899 RepID=A0A127P8U2_9BURK|nr:hypothetical protein CFter6_1454 [Collimonas fungivorans]